MFGTMAALSEPDIETELREKHEQVLFARGNPPGQFHLPTEENGDFEPACDTSAQDRETRWVVKDLQVYPVGWLRGSICQKCAEILDD